MIYFIFLELTPEYVFSSFCGLGCECMFLPRLDSPVSFFFYLSSFSCKFHLLQPYPFIPAIAIDFSSDLSLCLWFSQWYSNCMCVPFWVHNAWRYWCWNVSARQSGESELKMMNGWRPFITGYVSMAKRLKRDKPARLLFRRALPLRRWETEMTDFKSEWGSSEN